MNNKQSRRVMARSVSRWNGLGGKGARRAAEHLGLDTPMDGPVEDFWSLLRMQASADVPALPLFSARTDEDGRQG